MIAEEKGLHDDKQAYLARQIRYDESRKRYEALSNSYKRADKFIVEPHTALELRGSVIPQKRGRDDHEENSMDAVPQHDSQRMELDRAGQMTLARYQQFQDGGIPSSHPHLQHPAPTNLAPDFNDMALRTSDTIKQEHADTSNVADPFDESHYDWEPKPEDSSLGSLSTILTFWGRA
ncbi:MAG: hypothetical protein Q9174_007451 [Haloplaca sp. 1 TL-2023]